MDAGRYRHRITIEQRTEIRGAFGEVIVVWFDAFPSATAVGGIPAEVLTGPGRELRAAGVMEGEQVARINFRYLPGITQSMRVMWEGVAYNIRSIESDRTARAEVRLICTAGVNSGE